MAAVFKSHILSRDEKGFGGVPFKRLLLGAVLGGFAYTLGRFVVPGVAIPLGVSFALGVIILTALRGGLPLWLRLWLRLRGWLLLAAAERPSGTLADLARLFQLPLDLAALDSGRLFSPPASLADVDLSEWVTFARARDVDRNDGLIFVGSPLEGEAG